MNPVQVDWLTLGLAPVIIISLGFAFYAARRKSIHSADGARLPGWGRVAQSLGIISALFVAFIQIMWGS
jgi:hypothetical protein